MSKYYMHCKVYVYWIGRAVLVLRYHYLVKPIPLIHTYDTTVRFLPMDNFSWIFFDIILYPDWDMLRTQSMLKQQMNLKVVDSFYQFFSSGGKNHKCFFNIFSREKNNLTPSSSLSRASSPPDFFFVFEQSHTSESNMLNMAGALTHTHIHYKHDDFRVS